MKINHEIRVGATVIIALAVLLSILYWSGNLRTNSKSIFILFDDVSGLEINSQVTVRGMNVGRVVEMESGESTIKVKIDVDKKTIIYKDAYAQVVMKNFMTDKKITLFTGNASFGELKNNETIPGYMMSDISNLISSASYIMDTLRILSRILYRSLRSVDEMVSDEKLKKEFTNAIYNFNQVSISIKKSTQDLNPNEISSLIHNFNAISIEISNLIKKYEPKLDSTSMELQTALHEANKIFKDISPIINKIATDRKTLLGKMIYDTVFTNKIDSSLKKLDFIIDRVQKEGGIPVKVKLF